MLRRVVYISSSFAEDPRSEVAAFIGRARERNAARGVTGFLLFSDGAFLQVLEGPPDAVAETLALVERDPRHSGLIVLLDTPARERLFDDWSMGWRELRPDEPLAASVRGVVEAGDVAFRREGEGMLVETLMRSVLSAAGTSGLRAI
ncbi:MAG: BLUF domain-containing protein [Pseudomonadota bacterium]